MKTKGRKGDYHEHPVILECFPKHTSLLDVTLM